MAVNKVKEYKSKVKIEQVQLLDEYGVTCQKAYNIDTTAYTIILRSKENPNQYLEYDMCILNKQPELLQNISSMTGIFVERTHELHQEIIEIFKKDDCIVFNTQIGCDKYLKKPIYKLDGVIGVSNTMYRGALPIGKSGTLSKFIYIVDKYVINKPKLSLAMILGVYGFVLDILSQEQSTSLHGSHDMRLFVNYIGASSIGKTSATHLSASSSGNPFKLIKPFDQSDSDSQEDIVKYKSIPFVIDDIAVGRLGGKNASNKLINLIHKLSTGKGSKNNTTEMTMATNAIISSSEVSLLDIIETADKPVTGYKARMIEIECGATDLFDNGDFANEFTAVLSKNYGQWSKPVILYLMKKMKDRKYVVESIAYYSNKVSHKLRGTRIIERYIKRVTLLLFTGQVINEALNIEIDLDGVEQVLVSAVERSCRQSHSEIQYDILNEYVISNPHLFCKALNEYYANPNEGQKEYQGIIINHELYITGEKLNQIITGKYLDVIKEWDSKKLISSAIETSKNVRQLTHKTNVADTRTRMYWIQLKEPEEWNE